MSLNPLLRSDTSLPIQPLYMRDSDRFCSLRDFSSKVYNITAVAFSLAGNWPFFGAAASFGKKYSPFFGSLLGGCEFAAYFAFRVRNFLDVKGKLFSDNRPFSFSARAADEGPFGDSSGSAGISGIKSSWDCKAAAIKIGIAGLGLISQFPIMYLVYVGNGENLDYSILSGVCEASFTILSLFMSLPKKRLIEHQAKASELEEIKKKIALFLEELPSKKNDLEFIQKINDIFSGDMLDEQKGQALLHIILNTAGENRAVPKNNCDRVSGKIAEAIGYLISGYLTVVNGAVSYKGILVWKSDQVPLAIFAAVVVSLANIKLLTSLCVDSAKNYYEGMRDIATGRYRPPLAYSFSPCAWYVGRIISNGLSWLSFGTSALGARDYLPAGDVMAWAAPISSALLLNDTLGSSWDAVVLWMKSNIDPEVKKIARVYTAVLKFKEKIEEGS